MRGRAGDRQRDKGEGKEESKINDKRVERQDKKFSWCVGADVKKSITKETSL